MTKAGCVTLGLTAREWGIVVDACFYMSLKLELDKKADGALRLRNFSTFVRNETDGRLGILELEVPAHLKAGVAASLRRLARISRSVGVPGNGEDQDKLAEVFERGVEQSKLAEVFEQ